MRENEKTDQMFISDLGSWLLKEEGNKNWGKGELSEGPLKLPLCCNHGIFLKKI